MKKIILAAASFVAFAFNANADTKTQSQTVTLALTDAIELTFTGATTSAVSMPFTTVNDYANGVTSADQTLKVRSNKQFTVKVKANAANFTYTGTATPTPTMPVTGVLKLMVSANSTGGTIASPFTGTTFSTLTNADQNLLTTCSNGNNQTFAVQYQATPGFTYPGGTYTVDVVYTATTN